jgi:DNA topoisomerase II
MSNILSIFADFWPSLLDIPGFFLQFITPIVKATTKTARNTQTFFTLPEYSKWMESTKDNGKGYTIKYYKGLGTSTNTEAKEYFSNLDLHQVPFATLSSDKILPLGDEDDLTDVLPDVVSSGSDLIDMAFRKKRVDDRKKWLNKLQKDTFFDYAAAAIDGVKYSDFVNRELILFSAYDNQRSIPHLFDGFKPSQRKVLYACIKRNLKNELKVAQLAGSVAELSAYHHGEKSLQDTIVNMAQNFCGSNNINLLTPSGQFGTRRMGGKDHASARYIFTKLEKVTRTIFHPDDDELLDYIQEEGQTIEPVFYMPVIPMALVNGTDGIGTGWSSTINNYNAYNIIENIRRKIAGQPLQPMNPYYYGFDGNVSTYVFDHSSRPLFGVALTMLFRLRFLS